MEHNQLLHTVAYCGLVCGLCGLGKSCSCKGSNHCGKRLSPNGCHQYNCCAEKGINGCWECQDAPCGRDMLAPEKIKLLAFVRCIKEDGIEKFTSYLAVNQARGIVYHRTGILGDYDLQTEEEVLALLRSANTISE